MMTRRIATYATYVSAQWNAVTIAKPTFFQGKRDLVVQPKQLLFLEEGVVVTETVGLAMMYVKSPHTYYIRGKTTTYADAEKYLSELRRITELYNTTTTDGWIILTKYNISDDKMKVFTLEVIVEEVVYS